MAISFIFAFPTMKKIFSMAFLEKKVAVKKSILPGAGKGLFAKEMIPKGTRIVEYKGEITTWKEVDHNEGIGIIGSTGNGRRNGHRYSSR